MSQPLFDPGPVTQESLTGRQLIVFDLVAKHRDGISADEAGAILHASRGKHPDEQRCDWCAIEGKDVLAALRRKDLVVRRQKTGLWQLRRGVPRPGDRFDEIPF